MSNKYLLSVDIEGITGVISTHFSGSSGKNYELARKYMAHDVNAVIAGILQADANAAIVVRDAHGSMAANLDLEKIHPRAQVIQGWGDSLNMLESLDSSYRGVFLVGFHAGGHNNHAVLAHTFSSLIHYIKANGKVVNEAGVAGIYASGFAVPVAFISGDQFAIAEANEVFTNIVGVIVKTSIGRDGAMSSSLEQARRLLEDGARTATENLLRDRVAKMNITLPITTEIKLYNEGYYVSVYQKICKLLEFDASYKFDQEQLLITFVANSPLEFSQRINLLIVLIYGMHAA